MVPDRLLHLFGRCNYGAFEREEDLLMARSNMAERMRRLGDDPDTVAFTWRMIRGSQRRLERHDVDWRDYPDRPAVRQESDARSC